MLTKALKVDSLSTLTTQVHLKSLKTKIRFQVVSWIKKHPGHLLALLFESCRPMNDWGLVDTSDTSITSIWTSPIFVICHFCFLSDVDFLSQKSYSADTARQSTLGLMFVFTIFTLFCTIFFNFLASNRFELLCEEISYDLQLETVLRKCPVIDRLLQHKLEP